MIGLLLAATSWATDRSGASFDLLAPSEVAAVVRLEPLSIAVPPEGVEISWPALSGYVNLVLENQGSAVVAVDWNQSAFVGSDGRSVGIVPGSTKKGDVTSILPPSIVPPMAKLEEALVREDAVDYSSPTEPLVVVGDLEREVGVTLALAVNGEALYVTERFRVTAGYDVLRKLQAEREEELSAWEAQRAEAESACEAAKQKSASTLNVHGPLQYELQQRGTGWLVAGLGGAGLGGVMVLASLPYEGNDFYPGVAGAGVAVAAASIPAVVRGSRKVKEARALNYELMAVQGEVTRACSNMPKEPAWLASLQRGAE